MNEVAVVVVAITMRMFDRCLCLVFVDFKLLFVDNTALVTNFKLLKQLIEEFGRVCQRRKLS